jgi:hypothetical protein
MHGFVDAALQVQQWLARGISSRHADADRRLQRRLNLRVVVVQQTHGLQQPRCNFLVPAVGT